MCDPVSVAGLAITVAGAGAKLSLGLFEVVHAFRNAPQEIADIAHELSILSAVLNQLSEVLSVRTNLCKPEVFNTTWSTLQRFEEVSAELTKITAKRKRLKRLRWFFEAPKAKVLLQKVESIKSALSLVLGVIRIAEEQEKNSQRSTELAYVVPSRPPPYNRYRKTVESSVQASRLAVESAQKEAENDPTEKRRRYDGELQRWTKKSDDTATWLYHLVFETEVKVQAAPATTAAPSSLEGYSTVTVENEDEDDASDVSEETQFKDASDIPQVNTQARPKSFSTEGQKCTDMIVWSQRTEPSLVVDRLLHAWTYLQPDQIEATKKDHWSDADKVWREELVARIQTYVDDEKKRGEKRKGKKLSFADQDCGYTDDESEIMGSDAEVPGSLPRLPARAPLSAFRSNETRERGNRSTKPEQNTRKATRASVSHASSPPFPRNPLYSQYGQPGNPFQQYEPHPPGYAETVPSVLQFASMPPPPPSFIPPVPQPQPQPQPAVAPPPPPTPVTLGNRQERILELIAKLESNRQDDMSAIETKFAQIFDTVLQRELGSHVSAPSEISADHDRRIESLYELFVNYQEEQMSRGTAARALAEAERIKERQKQDLEAQEHARAAAHAEAMQEAVNKARREVEEQAARKAKEAQEAVDRQLSDILQKVSQTETELLQRAKEQADAKAAEQRRETEENYKKLIEGYREELKVYRAREEEQQAPKRKSQNPLSPVPLRTTTFISGHDRRVEVHEYADACNDPYVTARRGYKNTSGEPLGFDFFPQTRRSRRPHSIDNSSNAFFHGSARSVVSDDDEETRASQQKVIILPSRPHRDLETTSQMQSCLDECGMSVQFENQSNRGNMLVPPSYTEEDSISGTVFWEPPSLSASSELLRNLKLQGWKPLYIRISDCGQTYFLGNQPVHVNFFKPHYKPQMDSSPQHSPSEYVVLGKDLIHEYALQELGFDFKPTDTGGYALDCRLTSYDIDHLIERSFMIREAHFRSQYRKLTWKTDPNDDDVETMDDQSSDASSTSHSADDIDERGNETSFTSDAMDDGMYESFEGAIVRRDEDEQLPFSPGGLPTPGSTSAFSEKKDRSDSSLRRRTKKEHVD